MSFWKPFRVRIGKGTPIKDLPINPSNLPPIPKIKITSITALRSALSGEEKIEQTALDYSNRARLLPGDCTSQVAPVAFRSGVQWRDLNPSPEVLKLVEALRTIDSASFKDCLGCQSNSEYGYEIARDALTEWENK